MAIYLTEEQIQKFIDNGISEAQIGFTIEDDRANGKTDEEIMKSINSQLKKFEGQEKVAERQAYEQAHPIISNIQQDFQPGYRRMGKTWENQAKYGNDIPAKENIKAYLQELVPAANIATTALTGGITAGTRPLLQQAGRAALQGAIQGGVLGASHDIGDNGLRAQNINEALKGITAGSLIGGSIPYAGAGLGKVGGAIASSPVGQYVGRVAGGAKRGLLESFAMGKEVMDRLANGPRGTEISKQADYYGKPEFLNDIANRFKGGLDTFRAQEKEEFRTARDNLIKNNQDNFDISDIIKKTYDDLTESGLIDSEGLTRTGHHAVNLRTLIDDLADYEGKQLNADALQKLKTEILDDIIDYRPEAGKNLNNATKSLQNVAKNARYNINSLLQETLGPAYKAANQKISKVLNVLDNIPELKTLTNTDNIDTLAGKLKQAGTQRFETQKQLNALEDLMNESGITVSENGLVNDILDYHAAKEIQDRIRTGLDTPFKNVIRKAVIQPATEFHYDRVVPAINKLKEVMPKVTNKVKSLITPTVYRPQLYGGVEYNDYGE